MHYHLHHTSLRCLEFLFISSVIVHVLNAQRIDVVTVASKSLSLCLSGSCGDVISYLWLVNVADAHVMWCSHSTCAAFLKVMS